MFMFDCFGRTAPLEKESLPQRKTKGSAGYDFFAREPFVIPAKETVKIATGIKCFIKDGFVLKIYPRSSLGFKYRLSLCNTTGVIDSDYYNNPENDGHIYIKLYNPTCNDIHIKSGEAYAQGIFERFYLAEEDEVTAERVGGIGSTNTIREEK